MSARPLLGVFVSETLDMDAVFGAAFRSECSDVENWTHSIVHEPAGVDFSVAWRPPVEGFRSYTNLKLVASIAAGTDNIFACPILRPGVPVVRVRDPEQARIASVFVLGHVINRRRRFDRFQAQQRARVWLRHYQPAASETFVGVLGLGHIGRQIASDIACLGFRTLGFRQSADGPPLAGVECVSAAADLGRVLGQCDTVICALPLTPATRHSMNRAFFEQMKPDSYLIHVGRGERLVEANLLEALDKGRPARAALDVFDCKMLPVDYPFWTDPRILVTPHDVADVRRRYAATTGIAEARRALAGEQLLYLVDPSRGYWTVLQTDDKWRRSEDRMSCLRDFHVANSLREVQVIW